MENQPGAKNTREAADTAVSTPDNALSPQIYQGLGVSAGVASGPAHIVAPAPGVDSDEPACTDLEADSARVREAMAIVAANIKERIAIAPPETVEVLKATAQMARDKGLAKAIDKELRKGKGITAGVAAAVDKYAKMFEQLGGYMAERVTDLFDVRDRLICQLRGLPEPGIGPIDKPVVLLAKDLSPAETAVLDTSKILGVVTELGGPTSHTAILCAQLGVPAVVQVAEAASISAGTQIALNGNNGQIIVNPNETQLAELTAAAQTRAALLQDCVGTGKTADGYAVKLLANLGSATEAQSVAAAAANDPHGVEGCGLFRTEFVFLDRKTAPSQAEQTEIYRQVLASFGDRRVVVRTLDAGADKPLAFADLGEEENPALGVRGLRLTQQRPELLDTQLQALAAAQAQTEADLWVMAPMVATLEDARWFKERAQLAGLDKIGIMIEVPAAALQAEELLKEVDFASIGTNDLTQYTMAADRMEGRLAPLNTVWQPALLRLIQMAGEGAAKAGVPLGVCGEAGGDPLLALVLVGLGVKSLSMAAPKVAAVRKSLSLVTYEQCQQLAKQAIAAGTAELARATVFGEIPAEIKALI